MSLDEVASELVSYEKFGALGLFAFAFSDERCALFEAERMNKLKIMDQCF